MAKIYEKSPAFFATFERKPSMQQTTHYCPGCGHGVLNKIIADQLAELGLQDQAVFVGPVGCGVFIYYYFASSSVSSAHGRASAVATGVSRANPEAVTISYQGDGDLAAIGTSNAVHAANRGENMIVFFVNNNIYGMTGGQLAPTTLIDQKSATSPYGRTTENDGFPLRMAEMIAGLEAPALVARVGVNNPGNVRRATQVIRKGLEIQRDRKGYAFIEVLSQCPTNWKKEPEEACDWIDAVVAKQYPLGILKDNAEERPATIRACNRQVEFAAVAKQLGLKPNEVKEDQQIDMVAEELRFKFAGFGGQGVLSLGMLLAQLAMRRNMEVTWLPSYGPEVRGGVANSSVVVSKKTVGSPVVETPDLLVALNRPSLEKFGPLVAKGGMIIYNSSLIDQVPDTLVAKVFALAATDMAAQAGNVKAANTVVLGFIARKLGLFRRDELRDFLRETFTKPALQDLNLKALEAGWQGAGEATESRSA